MMNRQGFSLLELLITAAIMAGVIALSGPVYNRILNGVKQETASSEVTHDFANSFELLRLDLEHAGFGIARNETSMPVVWTGPPPGGTPETLVLRSTLNNTDANTMGWALIDCTAGGIVSSNFIVNALATPGRQSLVLLKGYDASGGYRNFGGRTTSGTYTSYTCPESPEIYTAYPYSGTTNGCGGVSAGGMTSWCTQVTYKLSTTQTLAECAPGTFNLLRVVGSGAGTPIVNCVADFKVRFDVDSNGNGSIESTETDTKNLPSGTAGNLMDRVKNIKVFLLVQAGQRDERRRSKPNYTPVPGPSGVTLSAAGIAKFNRYSWKVIELSAKPMSSR